MAHGIEKTKVFLEHDAFPFSKQRRVPLAGVVPAGKQYIIRAGRKVVPMLAGFSESVFFKLFLVLAKGAFA